MRYMMPGKGKKETIRRVDMLDKLYGKDRPAGIYKNADSSWNARMIYAGMAIDLGTFEPDFSANNSAEKAARRAFDHAVKYLELMYEMDRKIEYFDTNNAKITSIDKLDADVRKRIDTTLPRVDMLDKSYGEHRPAGVYENSDSSWNARMIYAGMVIDLGTFEPDLSVNISAEKAAKRAFDHAVKYLELEYEMDRKIEYFDTNNAKITSIDKLDADVRKRIDASLEFLNKNEDKKEGYDDDFKKIIESIQEPDTKDTENELFNSMTETEYGHGEFSHSELNYLFELNSKNSSRVNTPETHTDTTNISPPINKFAKRHKPIKPT